MNIARPLVTALILLASLLSGGCAGQPPLKTVDHLDLDRYLGRWYVIAHIPYWLEQGKVASYDSYARRPDGRLQNDFTFRRERLDAPEETWKGTARVVNTQSNAEWAVQFVWPFTASYLVIDLDPDYRWAVIGHPSRRLLWVLARERQLDEATYQAILRRAAAQGYQPDQVRKVPQPAD